MKHRRIFLRRAIGCIAAVLLTLAPHSTFAATENDNDPIEGFNRGMFWFNDKLDVYVLEPAAKGWDYVVPAPVEKAVSNFFANLRFPIVFVNGLLQGKVVNAASDVGRFVVNTVIGFFGFFDPATGLHLKAHDEDFGQTLGFWGVPPGPYLVLPFLGPSSPRDTVGVVADSFGTVYGYFLPFVYTFGANAVNVVNARSLRLDDVQQAKEASLDYYVAVRNAYLQYRRNAVADNAEPTEEQQENLYDIDDTNGD